MPRKTDYQLGMEAVLNNPKTSFLHNPSTFKEIQTQSGMSMNAMLKHVGGRSRQKKKEPTDAEKSEARLNAMGAAQGK
jgi:hypothetical protein